MVLQLSSTLIIYASQNTQIQKVSVLHHPSTLKQALNRSNKTEDCPLQRMETFIPNMRENRVLIVKKMSKCILESQL